MSNISDPVFFWGDNLSKSKIALKRLKRKFDKLILIFSWLVFILGLLAFFYYIYLNQARFIAEPMELLGVYKEKSSYLLFFFVGLIFAMFIKYLNSEKKAALKKIRAKNLKTRMEISRGLSEEALDLVEDSYLLAAKLHQPEVNLRHLFWQLLGNIEVKMLLGRLNVDYPKLLDELKKYLVDPNLPPAKEAFLSEAVKEVLARAYQEALFLKQDSVGVLNILQFAYQGDEIIKEILFDLDLGENKIKNGIEWFRTNQKIVHNMKVYRRMAALKPGGAVNRAYTSVATPILDHFSRDLTVMAKYGYFEILVGREKEMKAIFDAFESGQYGILLVGPNGVGKRIMIEGLAQLMVKEEVPEFLKDKRLVEIDIPRLIGGASPEEAQDRLLSMINEVLRSRNIVLYLENLEAMVGVSSGGEGSLDLAEVLADAISRQGLYCLASIGSEDYVKFVEDKQIGEVMTTVGIKEPEEDEAIQIVESKVGFIEGKYPAYIDYNAVFSSVDMTKKYINDEFLPEKAIKVLQLAAVKATKKKGGKGRSLVDKEDVAEVISETTGIPVSKVGESETEKLLSLEENIHRRLIGQDEAVKAISGSLRRARAELREGKRPIASFLFLGPTGVGKTELAKSVAEVYFGNENYMVRLDMSEYQLADSVKKMIGDPSGSLGYLTEAVRKKPFSLVLLDEIEKAHPDVLNLFLQLMDDGRLTDGQGRTINFTNSIVVATSNAGALYIEEAIKNGVNLNSIKEELIENHLNKIMRPELINRFDGVVVFTPLSQEEIIFVTRLLLNKIAKSLEVKGVSLVVTDEGVKKLAALGYDPKFGARPLRRLLQDKIENEIANLVLAKKLKRRDTIIINDQAEIELQSAREL